MATHRETEIDGVLRAQNPWWATGALPVRVRHTQPRRADRRLRESERPTLVVGPRRSGKTATLYRLLDDHLRRGRPPLGAVYVPIDHPLLRLMELGPLVDRALRPCEAVERPLLLLDGLQTLPDWPERFLELVKTRPRPRILAASAVAPATAEAEYDTVALPPLRFREYCDLRGLPDLGAPPLEILEPRLPKESRPEEDYLFDRVLDPMLADYLVRGGFPEAVFEPDLAAAQQALREGVVARAVYQDLPAVVGVLKLADLERVLLATLMHGTGPLVVEALSDEVGLDRATVARYLDHLERAQLLTGLRGDRPRGRYFPQDPAVPNALLGRGAEVLARPEARDHLLAGVVCSHLVSHCAERGMSIHSFREGELEGDFVVAGPQGTRLVLLGEVAEPERLLQRTQADAAFLLYGSRSRRLEALSFFESLLHLPAAYFLYALA